jgi:MSHA biogenesis protein MshL
MLRILFYGFFAMFYQFSKFIKMRTRIIPNCHIYGYAQLTQPLNHLIIISLLLALFGCTNKQFAEKYNQNIKEINNFNPEEIPDFKFDIEEQPKVCMGVAVYSKDLPVSLLPVLLSKIYNIEINLSLTSDLKISFNHSNICLNDLLDILTELYDIGFSKNSTGYNMHINGLRTQFFTINYHNFSRSSSSGTTIQGKSLTDTKSTAKSGYSTIETKLDDKFWDNINLTLKALIGFNGSNNSTSDSNFTVYRESGVVVVNSYPRILKNIEMFINKVNKHCLKQVLIEAKILEITLKDEFYSGINWSLFKNHLSAVTDGYLSSSALGSSVLTIKGQGKNYLDATVQALSNQGKVSALSSPRVSTLNNQRAIIKFGEDGYYLTNVTTNIQAAATSTTSSNILPSNIELTPFFSGIALDTTPTIVNKNEVILHIHPTITTVKDKNKNILISGQESTLPLASVQTREVDTIVKAYSGDIIIIGGLMQNDVQINKSGPTSSNNFLSRLFRLFSRNENISTKTELVILLRPIIIDSKISPNSMEQYLIDDGE